MPLSDEQKEFLKDMHAAAEFIGDRPAEEFADAEQDPAANIQMFRSFLSVVKTLQEDARADSERNVAIRAAVQVLLKLPVMPMEGLDALARLTPMNTLAGLDECARAYLVQEFRSEGHQVIAEEAKVSPSQRPWRTLVRIERVDNGTSPATVYAIIPGFDSEEEVRFPLDIIPERLRGLVAPGERFHARVNIGAETQEELHFDQFEHRGDPGDTQEPT